MNSPLRMACIYAAEGMPTIVAAQHFSSAGIYYEQDDPFVVASSSWEETVTRLRSALGKFSFREANLRDAKPSDWPSFRASKVKSVRRFKDAYSRIEVRAVNDSELFYYASVQPSGESEITLQVVLNPYGRDEEMARLLGRLFDCCLRWPSVMGE